MTMEKNNLTFWLTCCMIVFFIHAGFAQQLINKRLTGGDQAVRKDQAFQRDQAFRLIFYNLENAFDTIDDPYPGDDEFLPEAPRRWTSYRYWKKIRGLYKVIVAAGSWQPPDIVGVCEVENRQVISDLVQATPLAKHPYRILHTNSPDPRGMDVAAIYHPRRFRLITHCFIPVQQAGQSLSTRNILYIKGIAKGRDTLHIYFSHWPSKWQGTLKTQAKRNQAARVLRRHIDSIRNAENEACIVAMGDFNDPPGAPCLLKHLGAGKIKGIPHRDSLYNLSFAWKDLPVGTQKYRAHWQLLDQIIVTGNMIETRNSAIQQARIFSPAFLLTDDSRYTGTKPFRTYTGYSYTGGFSDHLPVILEVDAP